MRVSGTVGEGHQGAFPLFGMMGKGEPTSIFHPGGDRRGLFYSEEEGRQLRQGCEVTPASAQLAGFCPLSG